MGAEKSKVSVVGYGGVVSEVSWRRLFVRLRMMSESVRGGASPLAKTLEKRETQKR
jgi:hypothetical protein